MYLLRRMLGSAGCMILHSGRLRLMAADGTAYPRTQETYGGPVTSQDLKPGIVARLRDAGCVFAEDEADVLLATTTDPATLDAMVSRRVDRGAAGAGRGLG